MSKKILLVKLDNPSDHEMYPPFSIMYIADSLKSAGYNPIMFHEKFSKKALKKIKDLARDCLFVGLSVMTAPSIKYDIRISKEIKKINKPVVWGGKHPTILPEIALKDYFVDIICIGEGEEVILQICKYFEGKKDIKSIKGIGYKKDDLVVIQKNDKILDLNKYEPYWDDLDIKRYLQNRFDTKNIIPYETSRGCPHRCKFCYNLNFNKQRWRCKDESLINNAIKDLKSKGVMGFYFFDDNFFTNKERALKIIEKINSPWYAELRADYFSDKLIFNLKNHGCKELFIGAESGSNKILTLTNKDITKKQIENAVRLCEKYDIRCTLSFMVCFPYETLVQRKETLDFMYYLHKKYKVVNLDGPKVYTPYPGTPLYDESIKAGFIPPSDSLGWGKNLSRFKCNLPWIAKKDRTKMSLLFLMVQLAQIKPKGLFKLLFSILKAVENYRWRNFNLILPMELILINMLKSSKTKEFFFSRLKPR